jgi:hypothetical protein
METVTFRMQPGTGRVAQLIPEHWASVDGKRWLSLTWDRDAGLRSEPLGDTDVADWYRGSLMMPQGSWWQPGNVRSDPAHARLAIRLPHDRPSQGQWWLTWWFEEDDERYTVELIQHGQMRTWPPVYGFLERS